MNKRYKNWEVLSEKRIYKGNCVYVKCQCNCGKIKDVIVKNLKSGISSNCGCIRNRKTADRNFKHGKRFDKVWIVWRGMKDRCYNKKTKQYKIMEAEE